MFFRKYKLIHRFMIATISAIFCLVFYSLGSIAGDTQSKANKLIGEIVLDAIPVSEYWKDGKLSLKETFANCLFSGRLNELEGQVNGVRINDRITLLVVVRDTKEVKSEVSRSEIEFAHTWLSFRYAEWNEGFDIRWPDGVERTLNPDGTITDVHDNGPSTPESD
jgi:hypothetical protein